MREKELIAHLGLRPHPEGGFYAENYRSSITVQRGALSRQAGTHIHYLLEKKGISRWHRIDSDELWHLYEGGPLVLHLVNDDFSDYRQHVLSAGRTFMAVVPQGTWQAAVSPEKYSLVGCTVVPGFEFEEFVLLKDFPAEMEKLLARQPSAAFLL